MSFIRTITSAIALAAVATVASAETINLRMANWLPPAHHMQKTLGNWIAAVENATNGEVKIELMTTPLAPPPGQYDLVKNGVVDIAYGIAAFTPKKFHKLRGIEMPFLAASAEAGSAGLTDWYISHGFDGEEFVGTKFLAGFTHAPFLVHSHDPLTSLDGFKGMKIRAGGTGIGIFEKLGAAPVFIPPGGTTEALQRGTVDATQFTWESLLGFRLMSITKNHLVFPDGGLYGTAFWVAMNGKSWDKLSATQREAIAAIRVQGARVIGEGWDKAEAAGLKAAQAEGNTIVTLSDADTAKLKDIIAYVETDWVKTTSDDGAALLDDLRATIAKH